MKTQQSLDEKRIEPKNGLQDESGIALLMSLGVMSLLIVLSLSFALTTMNSMKSVELSQDIVKARLFDESGFQKVYGLLSSNFADPNNRENLFPATRPELPSDTFPPQYVGPQPNPARFNFANFDASAWAGRAYWFSVGLDPNTPPDRVGFWEALQVENAGKNFVPTTEIDSPSTVLDDPDPNNQVGWIHILDSGQDYPNDDTPIVARIAYVIVDESGKIDPWEIVETDTAEGNEIRTGRKPGEIHLGDVIPNFASLTQNFQKDSQNGFASDTRKWTSYYNIYRAFSEGGNDLTQPEVDEIQKNLFPFSYDIEAYFDETGDKHRFNVGANDNPLWWDSLPGNKIDSILQPASNFANQNTGGIPWLGIPYNDPALDGTPVETQVAQVAANLIDYCDGDNYATYNITDASIPFYCGNEKVPYINEVRFHAYTAASSGTTTLNLQADIELVNMYDTNWDPDGDIVIDIDIFDGITNPTLFSNVLFNATFTAPVPPTSYFTITGISAVGTFNVTAPIAAFTIQINSISLTENGITGPDNVWDLAFDAPFLITSTTNLANTAQSISLEVNDPRNNLDMDEWIGDKDGDGTIETIGPPAEISPVWQAGSGAGTIGTKNANFFHETNADNTDRDLEYTDADLPNADFPVDTNANPWTISTAYIRNAPMRSLWELGAIHRGASWQTINLGVYNPIFIQQFDDTGLGAYNVGDANILGQVKLSDDTEVRGRVNINTYNSDVLSAIFSRIVVNQDYNNTIAPVPDNILGDSLGTNAGTPATLAINTLAVNGKNGGQPFQSRAQIATIAGISDNTLITQLLTDRAREEVTGKIANILTIRQNFFSAIITSQIVKDMITNFQGGTRGVFNEGVDQILAEQRLFAILYRDAVNNEFQVIRYEYLSE